MAVTSTVGMGSGIDINTMVSQLVAAEGKPAKDAIAVQEKSAQTRLSGLGTLKSVLSTFQTAVRKLNDESLFQTHKAQVSDETLLTASTAFGSVASSHSIEVTQLAKAQKSTASSEFADVTDAVGTGTLTFKIGDSDSFSITLGSSNNTLTALRDAVNSAEGNKGITASIIKVDSSTNPGTTVSKLVFTAKDTGQANSFSIQANGDANLNMLNTDNPENFTTTAAADAIIKIDGQTATRSSNKISDVIQGVTLDLKKTGTVDLNVTLDQETIKTNINEFISAYNSLSTTTHNLGKYGGSGANATGNGLLLGNSTLRMISSQLRQNTTSPVSSVTGNYNSLAMIGITVNKDGVMALDSGALSKALSANSGAVNNVFTSANGVANRLNTKLTDILSTGGVLDTQQKSLNNQLKALGDRTEGVQRRLDSLQKTLQKQYIAMDVAVGKFSATSAYLTQQFK